MWETETDGMIDSLGSGVRNGLGRKRTEAGEPVMWPVPQWMNECPQGAHCGQAWLREEGICLGTTGAEGTTVFTAHSLLCMLYALRHISHWRHQYDQDTLSVFPEWTMMGNKIHSMMWERKISHQVIQSKASVDVQSAGRQEPSKRGLLCELAPADSCWPDPEEQSLGFQPEDTACVKAQRSESQAVHYGQELWDFFPWRTCRTSRHSCPTGYGVFSGCLCRLISKKPSPSSPLAYRNSSLFQPQSGESRLLLQPREWTWLV